MSLTEGDGHERWRRGTSMPGRGIEAGQGEGEEVNGRDGVGERMLVELVDPTSRNPQL